MPFKSRRSPLVLDAASREELVRFSRSRGEPGHRSERARILLAYADGESVSSIARRMGTNRPKVERSVARALDLEPAR